MAGLKTLTTKDEQYLKVMTLRKRKISGKNLTQELQFFHLLFTEASSVMVSVEEWLPRSCFKEGKAKVCHLAHQFFGSN